MNKFDLKTARFIIIIIFICLSFALVVMQAYKYVPETNERQIGIENNNKNSNYNLKVKQNYEKEIENIKKDSHNDEEVFVIEDNEQEEIIEPIEKDFELKNSKELEPISELNSINIKNFNSDSLFARAIKQKDSNDYKSAIEKFKQLAETADEKTKADCYEQIAVIHAIEKRYGTALSFAQKAYNTYPNTSREILLARLYYKTGNIDKATNRVNNILKRDFDLDR